MPHKKLFFTLLIIGAVGEYLDEFHHIGWYLETGSKELDRGIGLVIGVPFLIAILVFMSKVLGFGEGKEQEEYYYDEEEYEEEYQEEDEEIYAEPVRITWWNDWYD